MPNKKDGGSAFPSFETIKMPDGKEGVKCSDCVGEIEHNCGSRGLFVHLWNSIYSEKFPWESNPWVWVIEFKRVEAF